ncbi:MAG: DNA replication and repair protein RecF [Opitutales bacterium]|nr:DNA replication and repair protein RecF [Opitutales bacterium]
MKITGIRVLNFRNIAFADLSFSKSRIFLLGENGQGKTNLLEAISLLTALRSFREQDSKKLIRIGEKSAQIAFEIEHERQLCRTLILTLNGNGNKSIEFDNGVPVERLGDFVGHFPVVVFSAQDIGLLRGAPAVRRRRFDMTLSAVSGGYLDAIQRYRRSIDQRNALLKNRSGIDEAQIAAFDEILATVAIEIRREREKALLEIGEDFKEFAGRLLKIDVPAELRYRPNVPAEVADTAEDFKSLLQRMRPADIALGATQKGPHRDDFDFTIGGNMAADFASEGQLRSLTLALGFAQLRYLRRHNKIDPIILADDILGELDPGRRENFWKEISGDLQIIATGTEKPAGDPAVWDLFEVHDGKYDLL